MPVDLYKTERSPCLDCPHKDREKNHQDCVDCKKRIAYAGIEEIEKIISEIPAMPKSEPITLKPSTLKTKYCKGCGLALNRCRCYGIKPTEAAANITGATVTEIQTVAREIPRKLPKTKTCSNPNCGEEKDLATGFHDSSKTKDGKHSHCKDCRNKHIARFRDSKKKTIRLYLKKYPEVYDQITELALDQVRSLEEQIIFMLKDWIENQGG